MAALTGAQVKLNWFQGDDDRWALIALRDVNTGDTLDLGPSGINVLLTVKAAAMIGVLAQAGAVVAAAGTVITVPAGVTADEVMLLAWGAAAT